jgi:hypothetical protein
MRTLVLVALSAAVAALASAPPPKGLEITIDPLSTAFTVSVGGAQWLAGLPPTASWGAGSRAGRPLDLERHASSTGTHPTLGTYDEMRFFWTENGTGTAVETAFQIFADGQTAILEQHFPQGLPMGSGRDDTGKHPLADGRPLLSFPDFSNALDGIGAVTWASTFSELATKPSSGDHEASKINAHSAVPLSELTAAAVGRANGGPVVAFDEADSYRSLVISPLSHFLASASYIVPAPPAPPVGCGIQGARGCSARKATDVTGRGGAPKVDLGSFPNLTRAQCCGRCTANPRCGAWARGKEGSKAGEPGLAPPGVVSEAFPSSMRSTFG